ncbi:MAG: ribulokinase [Clostridia bacterium]|nr:ribulokinase [Clostridia bacterium]
MRVALGLDFGSLSCRGVLARCDSGEIVAEAVSPYAHGVLPGPNGAVRQQPEDFLRSLAEVTRSLAEQAGEAEIAAVGLDTTASTVVPIQSNGRPLCAVMDDPETLAIMWKDHRAVAEAQALTIALEKSRPELLRRLGGSVGAESLVPKVMRLRRAAPDVWAAAYAFLEVGDWLTSYLTGRSTMSLATLTCKDLYDGGYPADDFFKAIDPCLTRLTRKLMPWKSVTRGYPGQCAGSLCPEAVTALGLPKGIPVTFAQMDGYAGLMGVGVSEPGELVMAAGTSTGFFVLTDRDVIPRGVCAAGKNSMLPGFTGIAAGQAASGDQLAWFVANAVPEAYTAEARQRGMDIHALLCERARAIPSAAPRLLALDWLNGNKSPLNQPDLSGLLLGLTLNTRPEEIYRALLEASAFGARRIVDTLSEQGVPIRRVLVCGGMSQKSPLLMQLYADVLRRPIEVSACLQTTALGSAMAAAAAAEPDGYRRFGEIIRRMKPDTLTVYQPDERQKDLYKSLYREYCALTEYFAQDNAVMRRLRKGETDVRL